MALSNHVRFVTAVLAVTCLLRAVDGQGASTHDCHAEFLQSHGKVAQTSKAPYQIVLSENAATSRIRVMLFAPQDYDYFVGFLVEGRVLGSGENAVGSFVKIPQETRTLDCNDVPRSAVTNSTNTTKKYVEFDWEAPSNFDGQVNFVATVVLDFATFWVEITSNPIRIKNPKNGQLKIGETKFGKSENELTKIKKNIYTGCGKNKDCVGGPLGCIQSMNCRAIVALIPSDDKYQFEMLAYGSKYVAFGLSHDNKMGDDGVIECVHQISNGIESVNVYKSRNVPGRRQNRRVEGSTGVTLETTAVIDDAIYCEVTVDPVLKIENNTYDLDRNDYFFLLAAGSSLKNFSVGFHDVAFVSSDDKWKFGQLITARAADPFYDECGRTKTCLGSPDGCLTTRDCVAVATARAKGNRYLFEMKARNAAYVAVGISNDKKMGNDSVMECIYDVGTNSIKAYMSWNVPNKKTNKRLTNQNGLTLLNTSYADGTIYCSVERDAVTRVEGVDYNLIKNKYVLLVAAGTSLKERSVGFHDLAYISSEEASFLSEIKSSKA